MLISEHAKRTGWDLATRLARAAAVIMAAGTALASPSPQWINHHPGVKGYRSHQYFEGYELPIVSNGPVDPQPTPDGKQLIVASYGWLWRLDIASGEAVRLTRGATCDARPAVSPDGRQLVFVRDDNQTMWLVLKNLETGEERDLVKSGRLDLDPAFAPDGKSVYYSSTEADDVDVWNVELATGRKTRITSEVGLEMRPQPLPDGKRLVYLHKARPAVDQIRVHDLDTARFTAIYTNALVSQTRPSLSPDGRALALNLPDPASDRYHLALLDLADPAFVQVLTQACERPLMPVWSPDQAWIYFVEDDGTHSFALKRVAAVGHPIETLPVKTWNWGQPTGRLVLTSHLERQNDTLPVRYEVTDARGHPLFPTAMPIRYDWQSGRTYFFSNGTVELSVPAGDVRITATHGFTTIPRSLSATVQAGQDNRIDISLTRLWNPQENGWFSADTHFHLNYGGPYLLTPQDLLPMMQAEDLDAADPMAANLHVRYTDAEWLGFEKSDRPPLIQVAQEMRNHFLGHIGLIQMKEPFWPWFYGPGYPVTDKEDRPNADVLRFARRTGAFATYVHPIRAMDPFVPEELSAVPSNLVADAVLGLVDGLEVSCLWINELGTSSLWYRLLNIGIPIAPTGGSDAFFNFYRCSTPGSNRVFVKMQGACTWDKLYQGLRQSRCFVSSGPLIELKVADQEPGGVIKEGIRQVAWTLNVYSATPVDHVEILVNGSVVDARPGLTEAGRRSYSGRLTLPRGGWVAARVHDSRSQWPVMNSRTFAHTAPIWVGKVGSTDPATAKLAAQDLLRVLDSARQRLESTYAPAPIPRLRAIYDQAKAKLEQLAGR